jgi:hypothetical protein
VPMQHQEVLPVRTLAVPGEVQQLSRLEDVICGRRQRTSEWWGAAVWLACQLFACAHTSTSPTPTNSLASQHSVHVFNACH